MANAERSTILRDVRVLQAWKLRKGVEMRVAGKQNERMLQDEGRDPHIIRRDGSALLSPLAVNRAAVMGGLLIGEFDGFDNRNVAPAQVSIDSCRARPHRHISSSIVCCAANALSNAASLRQVPAMSPRSRWRLRL